MSAVSQPDISYVPPYHTKAGSMTLTMTVRTSLNLKQWAGTFHFTTATRTLVYLLPRQPCAQHIFPWKSKTEPPSTQI